MDKTKFYIAKSFGSDQIHKANDGDSKFLGFVELIIASTHTDREGEEIAPSFIKSIQKDMEVNTASFYNHLTKKRSDLPIGKVTKSELVKMEGGHLGVNLRIGISKTAPDIWTLIEEGILNKGSIGGYITEKEYNHESNSVILKSGMATEPSIVGIPTNPEAEIHNVFKALRKSFDDARKVKNKHIESEIEMDAQEMKKMMDQIAIDSEDRISKKFTVELDKSSKVNEKLEKDFADAKTLFDKEKEEMKKSLELAEIKADEALKKSEELQKAMGNRSSSRSNSSKNNEELYKDEKYAMAKGLYDFGDFLVNGKGEEMIVFEGSLGSEGFNFK